MIPEAHISAGRSAMCLRWLSSPGEPMPLKLRPTGLGSGVEGPP